MVKNRFAPLFKMQTQSIPFPRNTTSMRLVEGEGVVPSGVLSTVPASSRAVRRLVLTSSQAKSEQSGHERVGR